ncbi:MAG TPA: glycosyltransferase family 39 protein [Pyrinomonadaceae bacterium]|jgi:4-amino-4-deoxy-L-arabinose transferase-like glycosyltransferase|nr:glycosyltransferase family 39 protein [Pyrinomonadaceae bacterium]
MIRDVADKEKDAPKDSRWLWWLAALFLLALLMRCWAVTFYPAEQVNDAADYHRLAADLARGLGYVNAAGAPTAWRPPGYPAFLAVVYSIFGASIRAATLTQALLGSLTVLLLAIFGALVLGRREALIAAALAAIYPGLFWLPRVLLSENLSLFLTLAALCAAAMLLRTERLFWAGVCGVLLGLCALVRGANLMVAIVLLAGMVFIAWRRGRRWRQLAAASVLVCAGCALALLPWTARNYRVFHRLVPVATQDGMGLYASYWPPVRDGKMIWGNLPGDEDPAWAAATRAGDEATASKYLQRVTLERLREHPGHFFRVLPPKLLSLAAPFDWEWFPHAPGTVRSLNPVYVLLLIPAMLGLLVLRRRPAPHGWLLWVLPLTVLAQAVIFYGSPRFRLPAETSVLLWAAVALVSAWDWFRRRWRAGGTASDV